MSRLNRLRQNVNNQAIRLFFENLSRFGSLLPQVRRHKTGLRLDKDVIYSSSGQLLDVWQLHGASTKPRPVVLYVHGGGFRLLSKDTNWTLAALFAQAGFCVFSINYRLSPKFKYPAALQDVCEAYAWIQRNAARYGADPSRVVLTGESAGANLITALAVATTFKRPEPFASDVFELGVVPEAIVPMCGILQVSDTLRFSKRRKLPRLVADRVLAVEQGYLQGQSGEGAALADPLVVLESDAESARPFPRTYASVGTADPILDDTRRLERALHKRGVDHQVSYFPGEPHGFHALLFRRAARDAWRKTFAFLGTRSAI